MDSLYDELFESLINLEKNMRNTEKLFQHNHQPVRFVVPNCVYCLIHGNILEPKNKSIEEKGNVSGAIVYSIHYDVIN